SSLCPSVSAQPPGLGRLHPVPPPPAPAGSGHRPLPAGTGAPAASGMPRWLKTTLLAVGLVVGAAFVAGLVLLVLRRRRRGRSAAEEAGIVLADYDRVVVTCSQPADTVYVLRPPGADPREILRVARLVLPEDPYRELADQLGLPAGWPIEKAVPAGAGRGPPPPPASCPARRLPLTEPPGAAAAPGPAARPAVRYVVQPGDTLAGIAARLGVRGGWPALYAANRPRVGPDPDVIRPGTVLVLPGRRAPARYTVVSGDTLA